MFHVTRVIEFCYGHRLLDYAGKCRHPHGHNARVEVTLARKKLDRRGMAVDFDDIKREIQTWVDERLDHRMLFNRRDVLMPLFKKLNEPVFLMSGNPTAENIAKVIFEAAAALKLPVVRVKVWETPKSWASYGPPG